MSDDEEVRRRTSRQREWQAWAGSIEELQKVGRIVAKLHEALPSATAADRLDRTKVETVVRHGSDSVAGPTSAAFAEMDRRTVTEIAFRITGPFMSDSPLSVTFRSDSSIRPGVLLQVSSSDSGWVNQALASLSEEIDKGCPDWSAVHRTWPRGLLQVGTAVVLGIVFSRILRVYIPGFALAAVVGNIVALAVVIPFMASDRLWLGLFPKIELLSPGTASTGGRRILAILALVVTILAGIFVNTVS